MISCSEAADPVWLVSSDIIYPMWPGAVHLSPYPFTSIHCHIQLVSRNISCLVWARGNASLPHISLLPHLLLYFLVCFTFSLSLSYSLHLFSCFSIPSHSSRIVVSRQDVVGGN